MWNRPVSNFAADRAAGVARGTDASPSRRLVWLFVLLCVPAAAIGGRLAYLQGVLSIGFFQPKGGTTETYEWIPARDGRILSAAGQVLAEHVVRYEVQAHYRWLESPPNRGWARRRALSRLSKTERRNRVAVADAERAVLAERNSMWRRLSAQTDIDAAQLDALRARVQRRVERMLKRIALRNRARDARASAETRPGDSNRNAIKRVWDTVVTTLTTAPRRGNRDPLMFPEQSDYHPLLTDVSAGVAAEIEARPELYPGLRVRISARRRYPLGARAAHLIGYRVREREPASDLATSSEERLPLPATVVSVGKTGLEKTYDSLLRGQPGIRRVIRNTRGEILQTEVVRESQAGKDVVLTLDAGLQQRSETLLNEALAKADAAESAAGASRVPRGGCLIVLDIRTGGILAAASAPRFDLNVFREGDAERWRRLTADPRRPLFPRAHRMALPPGSVFKVVSSVAVLESGRIDPDAKFHCRGYLDRPDRHRCYIYRNFGVGHGAVNLGDAICRSCNVYFFQAARTLGPKPLVDWAGRFGLGEPTGVDLPGERAGHLPDPSAANRDRPWYPGDTLGLGIGQSRLTVTPLQIVRMMAAVANDGQLVTPHLMQRLGTARRAGESDAATNPFPRRGISGLSSGTLSRVREGLRRVVQDPKGTGYKRVRLNGIEIAGKTGTAEVGGGKPDHAWFAGYAPASNPRVAFVVVLEHTGSGGKNAGPVAKELVRTLLQTGHIRGALTAKRD
ncbi:MAG: peptidoglycan D,D-transpeptidase FtsI family protein [Planctomycetaceae bacterium]